MNISRKFTVRGSSDKIDVSELSEDLKDDLLISFNLFKNDKGKVNRLKFRTLLFSSAMYKSSPKDINDFINEYCPKQELFSYEDLLNLVTIKLKTLKEKESDDLFNYINGGKGINSISKPDLEKVFRNNNLEITEKELNEMISYISNQDKTISEDMINREEFKKFYCEKNDI